jgi:hypothetical protein
MQTPFQSANHANPSAVDPLLRAALAGIVLLAVCASLRAADAPLSYNRDIRPILFENCFACHGPDSASRKADLRLDKRDVAVEKKAIVPSKPDESEMVRRIFSTDDDERMPPPDSHKTLTDAQKETLKRWIAGGAEYQLHWSLIAPKRSAIPEVKNKAWVRNPIDNFVLAGLEANGLAPAPEADRRTLARRLSLDLTGLPPDPAIVDAFVADTSADAYEKLVDLFMKSKHWGEHRGRYWLDAARYGDSNGIHIDNYREIWAYRNWVIDAFNRNEPFDRFTIEQLAGDLLPNRTTEQQVASGFNRCNITTSEGGAIDEEYLVLYARDRTETVGQVWLGTSVGCAVCHDHKFDPFTQKNFYQMSAFFNNTTQPAMDGNIQNTPPVLQVVRPQDRPRFDAIAGEVAAARKNLEDRKVAAHDDFEKWQASADSSNMAKSVPTDKLQLHAPLSEGQGNTINAVIDGVAKTIGIAASATWHSGPMADRALRLQGSPCELPEVGDFEKDQAFSCSAWIKIPANDSSGAIAARMEKGSRYRGWDFWVQQRRVGMHVISNWPEDGLKVVAEKQVPANTWTHVAVTYDGSGKAAGVKVYYNGEAQKTLVENDKLKSTIRTKVPFKLGQRSGSEPLSGVTVQDLRVYARMLLPGEANAIAKIARFAAILAKAAAARSEQEKGELYGWWLQTNDASYQQSAAQITALEKEQADIQARGTSAHVMQERNQPAMAFILNRGEYDKRREQVQPQTPEMFPPMSKDMPRNRLGFAEWLLTPEHPLTARVAVNRFWQELFGTGIVRSTGDFGVAGEMPSDQELLDWMAVEFRESGWDMKRFYKLLVTSAAYRQAATLTPEKLEKDPQNRLISRGPRFRMDAEMIRDYALAASGLLVRKLGGPSVKPYQPDGVWEAVAMIGSNTRNYHRDTGENLYRRSMYTFWKRSAPPASMEIFNAPSREFCTVRRERTDTPLQALVTLNDEQMIEAARHLAVLAYKSSGDDAARIDVAAKRLLARSFRPEEQKIVAASLAALRTHYKASAEDAKKVITVGESKPAADIDPAELAAWTMLMNQMMNLDEVLNK